MNRWFTLLFSLLLLPTLVLVAQTGKMNGKITDQTNGEPLIGANVIIVGTSFGAATDVNGQYSISNLSAGIYQVKASYIGYQAITQTNVRVSADLTTELNFQLPAEGISVGEVVVVSERPLINKSNTNAIRSTTSDVIETLPVRGINSILALTPGVVLQNNNIYIRGGRVDEVGYYLEGVNITNPVSGGRAVTIIQDAVEEIQVQAGGYTAEYGGANAGLVRTQLKSGSSDFKFSLNYATDNISFKSKADRFDGQRNWAGAYQYGYTEFTGTVSGPLFSEKVKFFGLINSNWSLDGNPLPFPGINLGVVTDDISTTPETNSIDLTYPAGPTYRTDRQSYTGTGTFTFDFNPLIFRLTGNYTTYHQSNGGGGNLTRLLDLGRLPVQDGINASFSGKITHLLSPTTYYELSGGYTITTSEAMDPLLGSNWQVYGDSVANANAGAVWQRTDQDIASGNLGRYRRPTAYDIFNLQFSAPNDIIAGYGKTKREVLNFNAAFSTEIGKIHSIKLGGELQSYTIRSYAVTASGYAGNVYNNSLLTNPLPLERILVGITNGYGYDFYGNEINTDFSASGGVLDAGLLAPKRPLFAGAYVEDKITYNDLILNLGVRFDYFDTDNLMLVDPTRPETAIDFNTNLIDPAGLEKTPTFSAVSPRLGFSFPVTDQTVFHAQYGKFVQQSRLNDMYDGIYATGQNLRGGFFISTPTGWNIRPTRTTQYEIGFTQQIGDFASFDITGYYKDVQDQVVFQLIHTAAGSPFQAYNSLTNGDFVTTQGVELSFNMRRVENIQVNGSVSFQNAQGTGSNPNSQAGIVGAPLDGVTIFKPNYVTPLDYNKAITGNFNLDYRFSKANESSVLRELGLSALLYFDSGHPYTLGSGKGNVNGSLEGDNRFRSPDEPLNSSTTPWVYQVDLRVDKSFQLTDKLRGTVYFYVINLLDTKNVTNVFLRTGTATDDGYLSDPNLGGSLHPTQRADYEAVYKAVNLDYYQGYRGALGADLYGPPRQIRFGVQLEY
jgi:outer membrane receptor protein involved in Fe transport